MVRSDRIPIRSILCSEGSDPDPVHFRPDPQLLSQAPASGHKMQKRSRCLKVNRWNGDIIDGFCTLPLTLTLFRQNFFLALTDEIREKIHETEINATLHSFELLGYNFLTQFKLNLYAVGDYFCIITKNNVISKTNIFIRLLFRHSPHLRPTNIFSYGPSLFDKILKLF